jgi:two-component system, chemotaxis family, CheB/CheR fusion protein
VPALRSVLTGDEPQQALTVEAVNRRGKRIRVRVSSSPLLGTQNEIRGVILITEEEPAAETSA